MNAKYEQETSHIYEEIENSKELEDLQKDPVNQFNAICDSLKNLVSGEQWDDTFYRKILDQITVYDKTRIDISLSHLPAKWRFETISENLSRYNLSGAPKEPPLH